MQLMIPYHEHMTSQDNTHIFSFTVFTKYFVRLTRPQCCALFYNLNVHEIADYLPKQDGALPVQLPVVLLPSLVHVLTLSPPLSPKPDSQM